MLWIRPPKKNWPQLFGEGSDAAAGGQTDPSLHRAPEAEDYEDEVELAEDFAAPLPVPVPLSFGAGR
jgi:hypothetical protein